MQTRLLPPSPKTSKETKTTANRVRDSGEEVVSAEAEAVEVAVEAVVVAVEEGTRKVAQLREPSASLHRALAAASDRIARSITRLEPITQDHLLAAKDFSNSSQGNLALSLSKTRCSSNSQVSRLSPSSSLWEELRVSNLEAKDR